MSWAKKLAKRYRVDDGSKFRLRDHNPADTGGLRSESKAKKLLQKGVEKMEELQDRLYAQDRWGILLIFQAMDAAGKDGVIKHVMSGVNPQGCQVYSFKQPSAEELDHDYLWRTMRCTPERGRIGIFNRSYYEEVLVVRVHPEILKKERIPPDLVGDDLWQRRYEDISHFERYLANNGIVVRKFFLNLSKKEQKKRFLARLEEPEKNWKFSAADVAERAHWSDYQRAYEEMIRNTSTKRAPWYVVPADNKWFTRTVVAAAIVDTMEELNPAYPEVDEERSKEITAAKATLSEKKS